MKLLKGYYAYLAVSGGLLLGLAAQSMLMVGSFCVSCLEGLMTGGSF